MSIKEILKIGNQFLRKASKDIDLKQDNISKILDDLRDTLHHFQKKKKIGRAIAGPQIGYLKRVVYMESEELKYVMINPEIIEKSIATFEVWDSCFSADVAFFGKTLRHKSITVKYLNENLNEVIEVFNDDLSELFQHEIDHLDGILFTDHIINNQIIMRSEWKQCKH
jgi:peptide deformylase